MVRWCPGNREAAIAYLASMEEDQRRNLGLVLIDTLPPMTLRKTLAARLAQTG